MGKPDERVHHHHDGTATLSGSLAIIRGVAANQIKRRVNLCVAADLPRQVIKLFRG